MAKQRFYFTPNHVRQIRDDYPLLGAAALAERFGCRRRSVVIKAYELGVRDLGFQKRMGLIRAARNPNFNPSIFDPLTPESAYVLGYIWADGCIRTEHGKPSGLEFICTAEDAQLLRDVARVLGVEPKLRSHAARSWTQKFGNYVGHTYQSKAAVRLSINSTLLADYLISAHGIPVRKSSADPAFPANIPAALLSHFVRGHFDGDGCITLSRFPGLTKPLMRGQAYLLATPAFASAMVRLVCQSAGISTPKASRPCANLIRYSWSAKPDLLGLHEWLYRDCTICLDRKRAKFDEVVTLLAAVKDYKRRKSVS